MHLTNRILSSYFYVVALKPEDGKEPSSPDSYENDDLVTYAEARKSAIPKPYIAAVVTSKNKNIFILGDGRNTSNPTSRRRRSTSSDYYNGPLESDTSYSIFQRIFINKKVRCLRVKRYKVGHVSIVSAEAISFETRLIWAFGDCHFSSLPNCSAM